MYAELLLMALLVDSVSRPVVLLSVSIALEFDGKSHIDAIPRGGPVVPDPEGLFTVST